MADIDSSLPQRTRNNSDVVVGISDTITPSQVMTVDADNDAHVKAKLRDDSGSAFGTPANPIIVEQIQGTSGDPVSDFSDSGNLAKDATANHDYTVSVGKTLLLKGVEGSASDRSKWEIQIEDGPAAGTFTTVGVMFNSVATPNADFEFKAPLEVAAGVIVRVIQKSLENPGHSVYSTIMGLEV